MSTFRLPTTIPLEEYPPPEVFIEEAQRLVSRAEEEGLTLRVMGGMAIFMRAREHEGLWRRLKRLGDRVFTDIDFVSYGKQRTAMLDFFQREGYKTDRDLLMRTGPNRQIFYGGRVPMVEVFYDRLEMNHTIDYAGRLELDRPTVPLTELLLQKLQIVHLNEKDVKDVVVLLRAHEVGESNGAVDAKLLNERYLSADWGFYHTATANLRKIQESLHRLDGLEELDRKVVGGRLEELLARAEQSKKSTRWKLRAKVGESVQWYEDVDEL